MFLIDCPRHGARVLLGPRSIDRISNLPQGIVLHWTCHCGQEGRTLYESGVVQPASTTPDAEPAMSVAS